MPCIVSTAGSARASCTKGVRPVKEKREEVML